MRYKRQPVRSLEDVERELARIEQALDAFYPIVNDVLHAEPDKPALGMEVFADGTDWNPGGGMGKYSYEGTSTTSASWTKL